MNRKDAAAVFASYPEATRRLERERGRGEGVGGHSTSRQALVFKTTLREYVKRGRRRKKTRERECKHSTPLY